MGSGKMVIGQIFSAHSLMVIASHWSHLSGRISETDISLARVLGDCSLHCSVFVGTPSNGILFTLVILVYGNGNGVWTVT